jgi:hypothetical protein
MALSNFMELAHSVCQAAPIVLMLIPAFSAVLEFYTKANVSMYVLMDSYFKQMGMPVFARLVTYLV